MSSIKVNNVSINFPIISASARSFKNRIINSFVGGQVEVTKGHVFIESLKNITFEIKKGERVGLIGHNGSGKSTLLRTLSKIYDPTIGSVHVEGKIMPLIDISLGIDPELTGRENIFLRSLLLGISDNEVKERIDSIIEFSELGNFIDLPVRTYSSGMQLRLAFSVATTFATGILFMDEWLSVGDELFRKKAESRMSDVLQKADILVIASHSKDLLLNVCTRIIWLEHGLIKEDGETKSILNAYFK